MTSIPTLTTARLTLRGLQAEDFGPVAEFYSSDRARFVGGPVSEDMAWRILAGEIGHWTLRGFGRWAAEETATGKLAGVIGPWFPQDWPEPEIGWDLMNGFEGLGYATEAARAALDYAFDTLGWRTAISLTAPGNTGSENVAKRLGAQRDGAFEHDRYGRMLVWRHSGPEARV